MSTAKNKERAHKYSKKIKKGLQVQQKIKKVHTSTVKNKERAYEYSKK